ncbi:MAG TPA: J domain-containing protein [Fimbriimonadaceae bacterium]|nr:J domain-containing protein [Fimbriimonadaceae bacterium]
MGRRAYDMLRGYVHREWERIQGVEREYAERELEEALERPAPWQPADRRQEVEEDQNTRAARLLGVAVNAPFEEIRKAFERLNKRSDPGNFPPASVEAREAAEIQKRVHWAYSVLTEGLDTTEKRFRSLEID